MDLRLDSEDFGALLDGFGCVNACMARCFSTGSSNAAFAFVSTTATTFVGSWAGTLAGYESIHEGTRDPGKPWLLAPIP